MFNQSLFFCVGTSLSPHFQHSSRYRAPFIINHLFNVPRAVNDQRDCPRVSLSKQLALARFSKSLPKFPSIVQFPLFCFIQNERITVVVPLFPRRVDQKKEVSMNNRPRRFAVGGHHFDRFSSLLFHVLHASGKEDFYNKKFDNR